MRVYQPYDKKEITEVYKSLYIQDLSNVKKAVRTHPPKTHGMPDVSGYGNFHNQFKNNPIQ